MLLQNTHDLAKGVIIMTVLILLSALLRQAGLLRKSDSQLTGQLVLKVTLPAIIFSALAFHPIEIKLLGVSGIVMLAELFCLVLAYILSRILKLSKSETGALMLVSAFGMSTMLGYPLIRDAFPGNALALEYAIITSEIGVGLLLFIIGPVIASYFGKKDVNKQVFGSVYQFIKSPIFISVVLGLLFPYVNLPKDNFAIDLLGRILTIIGHANQLIVAVTIGLLIEVRKFNTHITFLIIAVIIKLIIQPLFTYELTSLIDLEQIARQVSFVETSMPSAIVVAIFARQYDCEPELVSTTTLITLLLSLISVAIFFSLLF